MKKASKYKTLYQVSRQHRIKETQFAKIAEDSLDDISEQANQKTDKKNVGNKEKSKNHKKGSHMRSQSCPFMNPSFKGEKTITQKNISNDENKRTLKKKSVRHYMHKKNEKVNHKYSNSHISQDSSTVIVHNIPIQQLSSMLYSRNLGRDKNLKKSDSSFHLQTSVSQSNILSCLHTHADVYFQTKLQQQIKMYELNEDLQKLQTQSVNVKVKQKVIECMAGRFEHGERDAYQTVVIH